ncbi:MAG: hypothetical protein CVU24_18680, partial [Betaproteobacteria bacterium HGW-Betaproteobacteria-18]
MLASTYACRRLRVAPQGTFQGGDLRRYQRDCAGLGGRRDHPRLQHPAEERFALRNRAARRGALCP